MYYNIFYFPILFSVTDYPERVVVQKTLLEFWEQDFKFLNQQCVMILIASKIILACFTQHVENW